MADRRELGEHIDAQPSRHTEEGYELDPTKHHIEGFVPEDGDFFWMAINLQDAETAERMLAAAVERIRERGTSGHGFGIAIVRPGMEDVYSAQGNIIRA